MKRLMLMTTLLLVQVAQADSKNAGAMNVKVGTSAKQEVAVTGVSPFDLLAKGDEKSILAMPREMVVDSVNEHGETLLIKAIVDEKIQLAEKLIPKSDVNLQDKIGNDALLYAVSGSHSALVAKLLKAGAKTDRIYDEARENILFEAARGEDTQLVELLLKHDPKLASGKNKAGFGLIETANGAAQSETTLLLAKNADALKALSTSGKAALLKDLARQKKNKNAAEIRKILESAK